MIINTNFDSCSKLVRKLKDNGKVHIYISGWNCHYLQVYYEDSAPKRQSTLKKN